MVLIVLLLPGSSGAIQTSTLGAYPTGALASHTPWFNYRLASGQTTSGSITVDNRSGSTQSLLIYAVDAAPNGDGGFGMAPQAARATDAGAWMKLASSSLQLAGHSQQDVAFRLTMPSHPSVGPHYAGIIIQPVGSMLSKRGNTSLQIISRLGVRVYITVPGSAHPRLSILSLHPERKHQYVEMAIRLHNDGNTLLAPSGELQLTPLFGNESVQRFNAGRSLSPSEQIKLSMPTGITAVGFPRRYTARLHLQYGVPPHYQTVSRTITFWTGNVSTWAVGLGLLLLVAAGFAVKYRAYRHRNRHRRDQGQA